MMPTLKGGIIPECDYQEVRILAIYSLPAKVVGGVVCVIPGTFTYKWCHLSKERIEESEDEV